MNISKRRKCSQLWTTVQEACIFALTRWCTPAFPSIYAHMHPCTWLITDVSRCSMRVQNADAHRCLWMNTDVHSHRALCLPQYPQVTGMKMTNPPPNYPGFLAKWDLKASMSDIFGPFLENHGGEDLSYMSANTEPRASLTQAVLAEMLPCLTPTSHQGLLWPPVLRHGLEWCSAQVELSVC